MPFKIRTKLLFAFMNLIFFIMMVGGLIGYYVLSTSHRAIHKVEAVAEEIIVVGNLQHSLEHVLMPANDYLITGDRKYIDDFKVLSREVEEWHKKSEELLGYLEAFGLSHIEKEGKSLKDIKTAWQNIREISLKIFDIPNPIGNKDGARIMEEMDYRWGKPATGMLYKWQEGDVEEYKEAVELAEKTRRMSWIIMASTVILLLILGAGFSAFYSKLFVKPIEVLHERADAIANGNFNTRMDIKTGDEMQQLANAMNEMAAQLDSLYSNLNGMVEEKTKRLRESEEKYRTMIENSNDWIWTLTPDGRLTFINEQAGDVSGYSHEEWLGKTFEPLVLEDDLPMVVDIHNKVVKGEKVHYEVRIKRKDGGVIILSVNASPIFNGGKVTGTISFGRDITEQKQTEAAFRTLVGTAVSNVGSAFFHEMVSSLCTWIGVECAIVGELVDEGMVRALAMQLDGKEVEHYEYALAGTPCESATQKGYCEYREGVVQLFPADKDLMDMRAEAYVGIPIRDKYGKVNGILCAISRHKFVPPPMVKEVFAIIAARAGVEIDRKKAEEELRETNEYLDNLFNYANAPIIVWDPQFSITRFNHAFEALTGRKASDVIGHSLEMLFPPASAEDSMHLIRRTESGERWETVEIDILHVDGSIRTVLWNSATLFSKDGKTPVATIAQGQDITDRKKLEEALRLHGEIERNMAEAVYLIRVSDGVIVYTNPFFERLFGYEPGELVGKHVSIVNAPVDKSPEAVASEIISTLMRTGVWNGEVHNIRKDGTTFWCHANVLTFEHPQHGRVWLSMHQDISERKKMEEELAKHVDVLERYMKATVQREFRIKELRDRVEELEKRLKG